MAKWTKVGAVMSKKDGKGVYVKVAQDITLKKDSFLSVFDPRQRKNKDGTSLTEEQLKSIPAYVKHELFLVED